MFTTTRDHSSVPCPASRHQVFSNPCPHRRGICTTEPRCRVRLWWRSSSGQLPAQAQGLSRRGSCRFRTAVELLLQRVPQAHHLRVRAFPGATCLSRPSRSSDVCAVDTIDCHHHTPLTKPGRFLTHPAALASVVATPIPSHWPLAGHVRALHTTGANRVPAKQLDATFW